MDYYDYQGLTISEVAQRLAVSTRTVHRYLKNGLLEATKDGGRVYVSEESLRKIDSLKAAKVQGLVDPTRHTFASWALAAGESPEWVARTLGHVNAAMIYKTYGRYIPNLTRQDGSAFERRYVEAKKKGNPNRHNFRHNC
jgi:excisionase family DNA binding protein